MSTSTLARIMIAQGGRFAVSRGSRQLAQREFTSSARWSRGGPSLEERMKDAAKKPRPEQRWSNRVLITLSSCVGASTFMIGVNQGYAAGKKEALESVALAKDPVPSAFVSGQNSIAPTSSAQNEPAQ